MAAVLRACILVQRKRCLQEFALLGRTVTCFTSNSSNVKDFGVKHFSTESNSESEKEYIYKGILTKRIFMVKGFSILSSCVALAAQPFLYMQAAQGDNLAAMFAVFGIVGVFAIGTPLFLHSVSKNYVTDLYYYPKEDKYLAELYTFFLRKKKIEFRVGDVHVPDVTGMFTSCFVKGKPMFLHEHDFTDVTHYFNIMGHYKPIDFKLGNVNPVDSIKEKPDQPEMDIKR
ncbi:transmembrane protein 70 homolog, mitochondrial [Andrena cerasifolii]|uniref:transmembrane protein 70 homolog, mitochondrial n=1 Tax=Andrena cerasifolii TaxID=2819439 RepID=UPI004037AFA2